MKLSDKEFDQACRKYSGIDINLNRRALRAAIESLPEPAPGPATLRPIAEMPPEVPEGCIRVYASNSNPDMAYRVSANESAWSKWACDIRLPVPVDTEREKFEAKVKQVKHEPDLTRLKDSYEDDDIADLWSLWQLAKADAGGGL